MMTEGCMFLLLLILFAIFYKVKSMIENHKSNNDYNENFKNNIDSLIKNSETLFNLKHNTKELSKKDVDKLTLEELIYLASENKKHTNKE